MNDLSSYDLVDNKPMVKRISGFAYHLSSLRLFVEQLIYILQLLEQVVNLVDSLKHLVEILPVLVQLTQPTKPYPFCPMPIDTDQWPHTF